MRRFLAAFLALCVARVSSPAAAFAADIVEAPAARVAPASMAPTPVGFGLPAFGQAPLSGVELNSAGLALQAPTPARAASADAAALETRAAASSAAVMPQTAASAAGVLAVSDLAAASAVAAAPPATSHATGVRSLAGREFHRSFEPDGRYARVAKAWSRLEETAPAAPAASAKSPPRLLRFAARAAPVALALAFPVLAHAAPAVQPAAQAVPGFASALALGFWLGVKHAADADHVAAVSTIVARVKRFGVSWLLGTFWGIGHSMTILAVGAAIIVAKVVIPPHVGLAMEFAVALVLITLGVLNMAGRGWGSAREEAHDHSHFEDGVAGLRRLAREAGVVQLGRSLIVGVMHGLAGSAAVALLVLSTIRDPAAAMAYLLIFGVGTLIGMLGLSGMMEWTMLKLGSRWAGGRRAMLFLTGLLSLAFGLWVAWHIGVVDGLFSAHPHWTPS